MTKEKVTAVKIAVGDTQIEGSLYQGNPEFSLRVPTWQLGWLELSRLRDLHAAIGLLLEEYPE